MSGRCGPVKLTHQADIAPPRGRNGQRGCGCQDLIRAVAKEEGPLTGDFGRGVQPAGSPARREQGMSTSLQPPAGARPPSVKPEGEGAHRCIHAGQLLGHNAGGSERGGGWTQRADRNTPAWDRWQGEWRESSRPSDYNGKDCRAEKDVPEEHEQSRNDQRKCPTQGMGKEWPEVWRKCRRTQK